MNIKTNQMPLLFVYLFHLLGFQIAKASDLTDTWYESTERMMADSRGSGLSNRDEIDKFSERLYQMSLGDDSAHPDRWWDMNRRLQDKLISIPGHSEHFAYMLREAREKTDDPFVAGVYSDTNKKIGMILRHIQSPENVTVLANMAQSEQDVYWNDTELKDAFRSQKLRSGGHIEFVNEAILGATTLNRLGIRGYPKGSHGRREAILIAREWWKEVKAGKTDLSFVGRPEIYQLNTDGGWEKVGEVEPAMLEAELAERDAAWKANLIQPADEIKRSVKRDTVRVVESRREMERDNILWWLVVGCVVVFVLFALLKTKK